VTLYPYLDHILIAVKSLSKASEAFERLGFTLTPEGVHPGRGTHNRLMVFGPDYLELIAIRDRDEGVFRRSMVEFLKTREGLYMFALGTSDIQASAAAMRGRGVQVGDPQEGARQSSGGSPGYTWHAVRVPAEAAPGSETFLIQHHSTVQQRYTVPADPTRHPNGATGVHSLALAVADLPAATAAWERVLGLGPAVARTVADGSQRVRFRLGNCSLDLMSPQSGGFPFPLSLTVRVRDLRATASSLQASGVPAARQKAENGEIIAVAAEQASGVALQFVQAG